MGEVTRVCFVSQAAYSLFDNSCPAPFGGAELQMYLFANELAKDPAFDVHVVVQDYGQAKRQRFGGVTVWRYSRPFRDVRAAAPIRWVASALTLYRVLGEVAPDLCVETPAGFPTWVAGAWRRRHPRGRFVYWMASDADLAGGISPFGLERGCAVSGIRHADLIIAQNQTQADGLLKKFGRGSTTLPNGLPMPAVPPSDKDGSVLWVASSQELKRPDIFLDLAERRPKIRFVMVMPRSNAEVFDRVSARARALPNVEFREGVPFGEIQTLFDRAAVFVNTSTVEGFPNTFIQAAMGATPVLSLSVDPDVVVVTNGFGACAGDDVRRLGADLDEILADEAKRKEMGAAGFAFAKSRHDVVVVTERLKRALSTLLHGSETLGVT